MNIVGDWKINKEINIGEILSVLSLMALLIGFFVVQDRRIEDVTATADGNKADIVELKTNQAETNQKIESLRLEQKADLNRLDGKLDDIRNLIIQQGK